MILYWIFTKSENNLSFLPNYKNLPSLGDLILLLLLVDSGKNIPKLSSDVTNLLCVRKKIWATRRIFIIDAIWLTDFIANNLLILCDEST